MSVTDIVDSYQHLDGSLHVENKTMDNFCTAKLLDFSVLAWQNMSNVEAFASNGGNIAKTVGIEGGVRRRMSYGKRNAEGDFIETNKHPYVNAVWSDPLVQIFKRYVIVWGNKEMSKK